ncbi:MAG TPA: ABC transporter permease, partial [Longimicrobiales bacterium]|nr:ABC transporter permease [Longimicrobiales bacterium]
MRRRIVPSLVRLAHRVRVQVLGSTPAEEIDEELDFHVEMRVREHLRDGMSLEQARRAAVERFGDIDEVKAVCRRIGTRRERKMTRKTWWGDFQRDVGFALRQVRRSPGFAAVVVATLGVVIGADSAVFSAVNGVLLRPLPFHRPDELVSLWTRYLPSSGVDIPQFPLSPPELMDYREQADAMADVVPYIPATRTLTGEYGDPERIGVGFLGRGMFDLLGVPALRGRVFAPEEETPDAPAVAVLGYPLWQRRFGGEPGIVGQPVTVNGRTARVVGIMPEGFAFPGA